MTSLRALPGSFGRDAIVRANSGESETSTLDSGTVRESSLGSLTVRDEPITPSSAPVRKAIPIDDGDIEGTYDVQVSNVVDSHLVRLSAASSRVMGFDLAGTDTQFEDRFGERLISETIKRPNSANPHKASQSSIANDSPFMSPNSRFDPVLTRWRSSRATSHHDRAVEAIAALPGSGYARNDASVMFLPRDVSQQDNTEQATHTAISHSVFEWAETARDQRATLQAEIDAFKVDLDSRLERIDCQGCRAWVNAKWEQMQDTSKYNEGPIDQWLAVVKKYMLCFLDELHEWKTTGFRGQSLEEKLASLSKWDARSARYGSTTEDALATGERAEDSREVKTWSELPVNSKSSKRVPKPKKASKCKNCIPSSNCWRHRTGDEQNQIIAEEMAQKEAKSAADLAGNAPAAKDPTPRKKRALSATHEPRVSEHVPAPESKRARRDGLATVPISSRFAIFKPNMDP